MVTAIGRRTLAVFIISFDLLLLAANSVASFVAVLAKRRRPVYQVCLRQIYFTGNEAFNVIMVISITVGIAIITQISNINAAGRGSLIGKVFVWIVIRELGPLITALVVIARSGSAIAIELGQMKLKGEIEYLESLGIPGEHYLLMPRIIGVASALFILNIYFNLLAVSTGFVVAFFSWQIPLSLIKQGITSILSLNELLISCFKSLIFGVVIAAVSCRAGLHVGEGITQIPKAGTKAVIQSLIIVFILDVLISAVYYSLFKAA